jgi:hypothetical protein
MEESRKSKLGKQWARKALSDYAGRMSQGFAETSDTGQFQKLASYDAIMLDFMPHGLEVAGIMEVKARWFTDETLKQWGNEWFISKSKLDRCAVVARHSRVPAYAMVVSVGLKEYWVMELANADGDITIPHREAEVQTQKSTEGGQKTELMAYINLDNAKRYKIERTNEQ